MGAPLTPREQQIYALVARGLSSKGIANCLDTSERSVKYHLTSIIRKLGVRNRVEVALTFHGINFREEA